MAALVQQATYGAQKKTNAPALGSWLKTNSLITQQKLLRNTAETKFDWSGRRDLNSGPLAPHASTLPGCATPRTDATYGRPAL